MGLVITRRPGESFTIGDKIVVKILETKGEQVRVLVDAPRELQVLRDDAVIRQVQARK